MDNILKVHTTDKGGLLFFCPGCGFAHGINVNGGKMLSNGHGGFPSWDWNNSVEAPTISPSILVFGEKRCHSFVREGKIQFLDDCSHELAGKTVDLPEMD